MLWDLIRDFFVQQIFGGYDSNGVDYPLVLGVDPNSGDEFNNFILCFPIGLNGDDLARPMYIGLGDWLSTTATAISITIIVVLCCLFIYKLVKLVGGLIR